jgi:uncharacterized SAM-binding protein YcdF (DUF218 family)
MSAYRYDLWNILGAATWPFWLMLLGGLALIWGHRRLGRGLRAAGVLMFCAITASPISVWLMQPLETVFSTPHLRQVGNVVMLAGAEQLRPSLHSGRAEYSEAAERVIAAVSLQRQFPQSRLILVGGLSLPPGKEDVAYSRETALLLGVPEDKIITISGTANTYQNARAVAQRFGKKTEVLLVTSAFHMPRAILCFRKFGMVPVAYPVDSRLPGPLPFWQRFRPNLIGNFKRFDDAAHEWIGLIAYRWLGYTNSYMP